jgi:hypothetical protein
MMSRFWILCGVIACSVACQTATRNEVVQIGSDNPIVKGARKFVETPFLYDVSMGYYVTTYRDGKDAGKAVYPGGDIRPSHGVCTDLIVRAFREAGYDLQKLVHEDADKNFDAYPYARYNMTAFDRNIDHRRVPMLDAFFRRHAVSLPITTTADAMDQWRAGDIVVWDLTDSGNLDHIGIVSDKRIRTSNRPLVIDNFPTPGYVYESDRLEAWTIRGHYRFPKP